MNQATSGEFHDPSRDAPLDGAAVVRAVPASAEIAGMYPLSLVQTADYYGKKLPSARERYRPFDFYPTGEHTQLLLEACEVVFPDLHVRMGLRKLGRGAPEALIASLLGRVTLGSTSDVQGALKAMCDTFPVNIRPCKTEILEASDHRFLVRMINVHYFLDCHHVGVLEGTMRYAGVRGRVQVRMLGPFAADLLCTW